MSVYCTDCTRDLRRGHLATCPQSRASARRCFIDDVTEMRAFGETPERAASRLAEILVDFRDTAAMRQVRQAEMDLTNARVGIYRGAALRRAPQAAVLGASADSQQALTIAGEVASPHHAKETPCLT